MLGISICLRKIYCWIYELQVVCVWGEIMGLKFERISDIECLMCNVDALEIEKEVDFLIIWILDTW